MSLERYPKHDIINRQAAANCESIWTVVASSLRGVESFDRGLFMTPQSGPVWTGGSPS